MLSVVIVGKKYEGWKSVSIRREIDVLCAAVSLEITPKCYVNGQFKSIDVAENDTAMIKHENTLMFDGYIETLDYDLNEESGIISIAGREKSCDLVDCSVPLKPIEWRGQNLQYLLCQLVKPFGYSVKNDTGKATEKIEVFSVSIGETVFDAIDRLCKKYGVLPAIENSTEKILKIMKPGANIINTVLEHGKNIFGLKLKRNSINRFSDYTAVGQSTCNDNNCGQSVIINTVGTAKDETIKRYRPLVINCDGNATKSFANKRVAWEANVRAGRSYSLTGKIVGWTIGDGHIIEPNDLVQLKSTRYNLNDKFLVSSAEYHTDDTNGETVTLTFCNASIYTPEPESTVKAKEPEKWIK
jgi:prophage tail gpP-like protein